MLAVVVLLAPSVATTVIALAPVKRGMASDQLAVPPPVAVSLSARTPLTVTELMPLFPRPESRAVPLKVTELLVTDDPSAGLLIANQGPVLSAASPGGRTDRNPIMMLLISRSEEHTSEPPVT